MVPTTTWRRGVQAGLTRSEIAEGLTRLAFDAGWGKATKALAEVTRTLGTAPSR
jgi:4-carboxymuconolactone decarboxylase